jgi:hypothetical protein
MKAESLTDVSAPWSQQALDSIRIGVAHEYGDGEHYDGRETGQERKDLIRRTRVGGATQTKADHNRDRSGARGQGQCQRIEGLIQ